MQSITMSLKTKLQSMPLYCYCIVSYLEWILHVIRLDDYCDMDKQTIFIFAIADNCKI
jgi:hypothetical protein